MSGFDDPAFQAWIQQRDEAMVNAFHETLQTKVTEQTREIERQARERFDALVASTSKLQVTKDIALKDALRKIDELREAVRTRQQDVVQCRAHDGDHRTNTVRWAIQKSTVFGLLNTTLLIRNDSARSSDQQSPTLTGKALGRPPVSLNKSVELRSLGSKPSTRRHDLLPRLVT